jgi:hypothetical protein
MSARWHDSRPTPNGYSNNKVERSAEIFTHRWAPFVGGHGPGSSSKGTLLPAGNYEWPFELVIPGTMAESIEGLSDSHIVYKLKATVARGKLAYDLHAWKPIRVVRTLDPSALELAHAMTVENVWPNKIEYSLVIPQKAIIFGTAIDVEMRFTSLLKGLRIGSIRCQLLESQEFTFPGASANSERQFKHSREIDNWTFELNEEEHYRDVLNDEGQDGYKLIEEMPLPKKLSRCLQDVDIHGIKIRHKVKFNIALHNPDGHVSEVRSASTGTKTVLTITASCNLASNNFHLSEYASHSRGMLGGPDTFTHSIGGHSSTCSSSLWRACSRSTVCRHRSEWSDDTSSAVRNEHAILQRPIESRLTREPTLTTSHRHTQRSSSRRTNPKTPKHQPQQ